MTPAVPSGGGPEDESTMPGAATTDFLALAQQLLMNDSSSLDLGDMPLAELDSMQLPDFGVHDTGTLRAHDIPQLPPQRQQTAQDSAILGCAATGGVVWQGSASGSSGDGSPHVTADDISAESQLVKLREKSRTAQKRYRERQRDKLAKAEAQVADLAQQLASLKCEREALTAKVTQLQRCIDQSALPAAAGPAALAAGAPAEAWWMDPETRAFLQNSSQLSGDLVFSVQESELIYLTAAQIGDLPPAQFAELWKTYVNAYATCLLHMQGNASHPKARRLERLVFESGQLWASALMSHPDKIRKIQERMEAEMGGDGCLIHDGATARIRALTESAQFSDDQVELTRRLRRAYLQNVGILQRRREDLAANLQAAVPSSGVIDDKGSRWRADDGLSGSLAIMDRLRDTLRDEHSCFVKFTLAMWRRVFTPLQSGFLNVQAWPGGLSVLGVAEAVATAAGEPGNTDMVAAAAADPILELVPLEDVFTGQRLWQAPPVDAGMEGEPFGSAITIGMPQEKQAAAKAKQPS